MLKRRDGVIVVNVADFCSSTIFMTCSMFRLVDAVVFMMVICSSAFGSVGSFAVRWWMHMSNAMFLMRRNVSFNLMKVSGFLKKCWVNNCYIISMKGVG